MNIASEATNMNDGKTVVQYAGNRGSQRCGYCKGSFCKTNHGMWAHVLSCQDYQDLLDRGWRRSGKYCYKPIMHQTCCPQYTIRLDVTRAKLRKSQKKVVTCFNKYITTGTEPKNTKQHEEISNDCDTDFADIKCAEVEGRLTQDVHLDVQLDEPLPKKNTPSSTSIKGADPDKPRCRKAKEIRLEKKGRSKVPNTTTSSERTSPKKKKNHEKSIEEWIEGIPVDSKINFQVKTVRCCPESAEFRENFTKELQVYQKYQVAIHNDKLEEVDEKQFRRFLCEGPLIPVERNRDNSETVPVTGFGAFHQLYFFNDRVVAVGVLDILPNSVSSKYFFYDPEFHFLSLGTYSALREIYFIRSLQVECAQLQYYYMGFYIHSCPKMQYKGKFSPSFLLCPETYRWKPIESCIDKLDSSKYARLEEDESAAPEKYDINKTLVLFKSRYMTFQMFYSALRDPSERRKNLKTLEEYTELVGKASQSILLYRN